MKKPELIELAGHIADAKRIAQQEVDGMEDVGTCNFDTLVLVIPGTKLKTLQGLGVDCYRLRSYVAISARFGQAQRNTRGVEAMARHLAGLGYKACVWYQAD